MSADPPVDGLQPERTELAWRRTALSLGVAGLVGFRMISDAFGNASWAVSILFAIVIAGVVWVAAHRRYRRVAAVIAVAAAADTREPSTSWVPGGALPLALTVVTAAIAVGGLAAIVVLAMTGR